MKKLNKLFNSNTEKQCVFTYSFAVLLLFLIANSNCHAQKILDTNNVVYQNSDLSKIIEVNYGNGWIDYKKNQQVDPNNFFKTFSKGFNLGKNDEMRLHKTLEDNYGNTHYKYLQYYKGIEVEGSEYIIHLQGNNIVSSNGTIINNINIDVNPTISKEMALSTYTPEQRANIDIENGQLLITNKSNLNVYNASNYILAYKFISKSVQNASKIYIDAKNGEVIKSISNSHSMVVTGSCYTDYYGWQYDFQTTRTGALGIYKYWTREDNKNIVLEDNNNPPGYQYSDVDDNVWSSVTERPTVTALWSTERVWEYFYWRLGRSGMDNNTKKIQIRLNIGDPNKIEYQGPNYGIDYIRIGVAQNIGYYVSLDAIGHEFAHGVSAYSITNQFDDFGEAKNLEEGISDIFACAAENYMFPSSNNYLIGDKEFTWNWTSPYYLRSMSNPHITNTTYQPAQPEYYQEPGYWCDPSYYSCEPHVNSGVVNKWFWLLTNGGTFRGITVTPISINNGAHIVYYALTNYYLSQHSDFNDMKNATIHSAMVNYGNCSQEAQSVYDAWVAVNVMGNSPILENSVNCINLSNAHNSGNPYSISTVGTLNINCNIADNKVTILKASDKIVCNSGRSGTGAGTYFHAYIEPCNGSKMLSNNVIDNSLMQNINQDNPDVRRQEISETSQKTAFIVYPNPNKGIFSIYKLENNEYVNQLEIIDVLGNSIYKSNNNNDNVVVDISTYPKGIYIVKINSGGELFVEKIIVE